MVHGGKTILSAVILAGGESRRMGSDKAWLKVEGQPLLIRAANCVRDAGIEEIFISGRPGVDYSGVHWPVLTDLAPGNGPLGGIERALFRCSSPLLLVLAVDLPQMTSTFLKTLAAHCDRETGAVPTLNGRLEPLAAVYPRRCHALVSDELAGRRLAVRQFAETCLKEQMARTFQVPREDEHCFANWNSPADIPQH